MKLTKKQRSEMCGKYDYKCSYCGKPLGEKWHVDHIEPVRRGALGEKMLNPELDTIENMTPACIQCNLFKGGMPLETFREEISMQVDRAWKTSVNFRMARMYKQIELTPKPIVFWFELVESYRTPEEVK